MSLRLSYSLLNCWKNGGREEAIDLYLRIPKVPTFKMKRGTSFDKYVEDFVNEHKMFPPQLGSRKLENPECKHRLTVIRYTDKFDLVGEADVIDGPDLFEIKCGDTRDSAEYLGDGQINFYFFLGALSKGDAFSQLKRGWLYRYDPTFDKFDTSVLLNSESAVQKTENMIEKYGNQIYDYFKSEGILL